MKGMQKALLALGMFTLLLMGCAPQEEDTQVSTSSKSDKTAPSIASVSPADGATSIATSSSLVVTFSEAMTNSSISSNSGGTSCSGSIQLSSDSFATCVALGSPSTSDDTAFSLSPSSSLASSTTYKIKVTTSAQDSAGNALESDQTTSFTTASSSTSLSSDKAISAFSFLSSANSSLSADVTASISGTAITATVPYATTITALKPTFTHSGSKVTVSGVEQTSGSSSQDFTNAVTYQVTAADSSTQDYSVTVTKAAASSSKSITSFTFTAATNSGLPSDIAASISGTKISAVVPYGYRGTSLVPTFVLSDYASAKVGSTSQTSAVTSNDFIAPVTYSITAQDGSSQSYTVTVISFPIADTGQSTVYTAGDDGTYTGTYAASYTDNNDGTIQDNRTGLLWQKADDASTRNQSTADSYCSSLSLGGYSSGWRLPTRGELTNLSKHSVNAPSIDTTYFPTTVGVYPAYYWTSTTGLYNGTDKYFVQFALGETGGGTTSATYYTRCVRGSTRSTSYTDNGDGTTTDNTTGLVWQNNHDGTGRTFDNAIAYCEALTLGSSSAWRVPNIRELDSITDDTQTPVSINSTYFFNTSAVQFWSSTTVPSSTTYAWFTTLNYGSTYYDPKSSSYQVRCVRD